MGQPLLLWSDLTMKTNRTHLTRSFRTQFNEGVNLDKKVLV